MSSIHGRSGKDVLKRIAHRVMEERGFQPDFSRAALDELDRIQAFDWGAEAHWKDLRQLPWVSIDNDDSLDVDQLTAAEVLPDERVRILVAVADVDVLVKINSAIDEHARWNTTSVYTAGQTFPMLPERLSTNLTSLNYGEDRPAIVIEMTISNQGEIEGSDIYHAAVRNHAKLAYSNVAAWLQADGPAPDEAVAAQPSLAESLRVQDRVAQELRSQRHRRGALDLQTLEARPVFAGDEIQDLRVEVTNRAKQIIEDFMIAANDVTARFLRLKEVASLRRVVRSPRRWDRIVEVAAQQGYRLPPQPDSKALSALLTEQKTADPLRFPDLSLTIVKLLGSGEYVVELSGGTAPEPSS